MFTICFTVKLVVEASSDLVDSPFGSPLRAMPGPSGQVEICHK